MPAYRKTSKYNKQQTMEMEGEVIYILSHCPNAMTIDEIQTTSFTLGNVTSQKIARILGHLIETGLVAKAKSKSKNKMVYKSLATFVEESND